MKKINIKWKDYIEVNERIKYFREDDKFEWWSMESDIVKLEDDIVVIKAIIKDQEWALRATWLAYEKEWSSFINKTSYIENCETSAWGRALANLWIWIDTSVASFNEVANAIKNQEKDDDKPWFNEKELETYRESIESCIDKDDVDVLKKEIWDTYKVSKKMQDILKELFDKVGSCETYGLCEG
jgi:hypothetical protein